jgi:hypothetical protein
MISGKDSPLIDLAKQLKISLKDLEMFQRFMQLVIMHQKSFSVDIDQDIEFYSKNDYKDILENFITLYFE